MPPPLICAWCPGFDRTAASNTGASHVLCATCRAKLDRLFPPDVLPYVEVLLVPVLQEGPCRPVVTVTLVPTKAGDQ